MWAGRILAVIFTVYLYSYPMIRFVNENINVSQ